VIDGGAGIDTVDDWVQANVPVWPALAVSFDGVANDGRPGIERGTTHVSGRFVLSDGPEEWNVWGNVDGGSSVVDGRGGDDVIVGEAREETIDGGAGNDRLEGGKGNDVITGGPGRDTVYGDDTATTCVGGIESCVNYGNDVVDVRDGEQDTVE
jgi:Ca2+-binding RTX toxin-like protein